MTDPTTVPPAEPDHQPFRVVVDGDERRPWLGPHIPAGDYLLTRQDDGTWVLTPQPAPTRPYRAVDRYARGWLTFADPVQTYPFVPGPDLTLDELTAQCGPLTPVVAASRVDSETLHLALAAAHDKAMTTLLSVLSFIASDCEATDGSYDRLVAGRPGSWESALLLDLVSAGNSITADRVDATAHTAVRAVLTRWLFDETSRVEVAETLASILGDLVDGRGGWDQIADQRLRRSPIAESLHHYATGLSSAHGPY